MKLALAATMLATMLLPMAAPAEAPPGPLAAARQQLESADYRLIGHLVRVDGNGARTSYAVNISAHWFPGVLRVLFEVASPAEARVHLLVETRPDGKSTIQTCASGRCSPPAVLPFDKWSDGPVGGGIQLRGFSRGSVLSGGADGTREKPSSARAIAILLVSRPGAGQDSLLRGQKLARSREAAFRYMWRRR